MSLKRTLYFRQQMTRLIAQYKKLLMPNIARQLTMVLIESTQGHSIVGRDG